MNDPYRTCAEIPVIEPAPWEGTLVTKWKYQDIAVDWKHEDCEIHVTVGASRTGLTKDETRELIRVLWRALAEIEE